MKDRENIHWEFLAKHLAGETSPDEQIEMKNWLKQSESNVSLYNEISNYWNQINNIKEMNQFDTDKGWEKLYIRIISAQMSEERKMRKFFFLSRSMMKIAAAFTLLIAMGIGSYFLFSGFPGRNVITVATSDITNQNRLVLPDGSVVFMNKGTKISYSKNFNTAAREVKLAGEAYFSVIHNAEKPFIVHTHKADIKVIGTSFNVQALKSSGKVEVFVESGKVELLNIENKEKALVIEPGYIGYVTNKEIARHKNSDVNYLAWKTKTLHFNSANMNIVARGIQDIFNVNLVFENPDMLNCRIEGHFENEPLENIMETICTIHNWQWEKKGNRILLSGQGC
jgi:ferric-dicitrate binding protein FerR (iron transport regulator)